MTKAEGVLRIPALDELLARLDPTTIPHFSGNGLFDEFRFAQYELSNIEYRLNRGDMIGAEHCLERLRAHLVTLETELFPTIRQTLEVMRGV